MENNVTPPIPLAIVEWLERLFPDRLPQTALVSHESTMWNAGAASVARKVRATYNSQNKTE